MTALAPHFNYTSKSFCDLVPALHLTPAVLQKEMNGFQVMNFGLVSAPLNKSFVGAPQVLQLATVQGRHG